MPNTDKPVYLIINPRSGYGSQKHMLADLRNELAGVCELVEYVTQCAGDGARYAAEIAPSASVVIAFGGDGTINEVANGLAGTDVPLLIAAAGTENLLATELRIPRNPADLVRVLQHGTIIDCDVGLINGMSFHSILGVGFDAEVVRRVSAVRSGHISHLSYFWPIWRTFWEHDFPNLHIVSDGEMVFDGRGLVFVGNISRYSSGLRICRDARSDDGLLDLVVFKCHEQTGLLLHATWTLLRRHPLKGNVIYRHAKHIRIETESPLTCQMDGDVGPTTPLEITVADYKNRFLVPSSERQPRIRNYWPWKGESAV
jgi:YegS/Rv2252/BmrU family lipid kinase